MSISLKSIAGKLKQYPIVALAGLVSVLCLVAIFIRGADLQALETTLEESELEWDRIEGNMRRARGLEEQLEKLRELNHAVQERLLNPAEVAINYEYFFAIERQTGVRISNPNQGGPIDQARASALGIPQLKSFVPISYSIGVEGSFPEILKFLTEMTHQQFFVRVSAFNVTRFAAQGAGQLSANLQCQILGVKEDS
jgi:hypothetical protein